MQENSFDLGPVETRLSGWFKQLILSLSSCRDFSGNLLRVLRLLGEQTGHDRVQVVEIRRNMAFHTVCEWCAPALLPVVPQNSRSVFVHDEELVRQLGKQNYIAIHALEQVGNPALKELLQRQHCKQVLILPLFESHTQFAFIVFMQCQETHPWTAQEIFMLEDITLILARQLDTCRIMRRMLQRLKLNEQRKKEVEGWYKRLMRWYMQSLPDWLELRDGLKSGRDLQHIGGLDEMDGHFRMLEQLCRQIAVK